MEKLEDFGKVWMASSPYTGNFPSIRKAIDSGADTIVLKSATTIADSRGSKKGRRSLNKGITYFYKPPRSEGFPFFRAHTEDETLSCTSTSKDIEMISVEEANRLYFKIKRYSPRTKVVPSFAPVVPEDFERVRDIEGDGVEINTRWFKMDVKKPYVTLIYIPEGTDLSKLNPKSSLYWQEILGERTPEEIVNELSERRLKYIDESKRKLEAFREGMEGLDEGRPVLLKVARQIEEMSFSDYLALKADGFTFSDSQKTGVMTSLDNVVIHLFGSGSTCGESLFNDTKSCIGMIKKELMPNSYISASGGVMNGDYARDMLKAGADSVQICSAVYFGGFKRLRQIADAVNGDSTLLP